MTWRAPPALLLALTAQAPAGTSVPRAELTDVAPATLAMRLIGDEGMRVAHRRLCPLTPGTGCNGFAPGSIILSEDFAPTRSKGLCAARQWIASDRTPGRTEAATIAPPERSTAFRLGRSCAGPPNSYGNHGEFTIFGVERPTGPADASRLLIVARKARAALTSRTVRVDCRRDDVAPTDLCASPADAFSEARLATMYRVSVSRSPSGDVLRYELWGRSARTGDATHIWADVRLKRAFDAPWSAAIDRVDLKEYAFVD